VEHYQIPNLFSQAAIPLSLPQKFTDRRNLLEANRLVACVDVAIPKLAAITNSRAIEL